MRKRLFLAASLVLALTWSAPAAADTISFDVDGDAGGLVVDAALFDWAPGNTMLVENEDGTGTIYYQSNLSVIKDADGNIVYANDLGGDAFTAVATFDVILTGDGTFEVVSGSGVINIYADDEIGSDLTGTGFAADPGAVLILSGTVSTGGGDLTPDTDPCTAGTTLDVSGFCVGDLDQFSGDSYVGVDTVGGTGGFDISVNVTFTNDDYFLTSPGAFIMSATTGGSNNLPYKNANPSGCFSSDGTADGNLDGVLDTCDGVDEGPGMFNPQMCGTGLPSSECVNGTGTNILAESDAASTFQVIPEPATLTLLGLGLAGSAVARRRQLKKRQQQ